MPPLPTLAVGPLVLGVPHFLCPRKVVVALLVGTAPLHRADSDQPALWQQLFFCCRHRRRRCLHPSTPPTLFPTPTVTTDARQPPVSPGWSAAVGQPPPAGAPPLASHPPPLPHCRWRPASTTAPAPPGRRPIPNPLARGASSRRAARPHRPTRRASPTHPQLTLQRSRPRTTTTTQTTHPAAAAAATPWSTACAGRACAT